VSLAIVSRSASARRARPSSVSPRARRCSRIFGNERRLTSSRVSPVCATSAMSMAPQLSARRLVEQHAGLAPALETLRLWMAAAGLWQTRKERRKRPQPPRARRACVGEFVQIDGSDHEWFEDRGPRCTLLVYVDDATSRLMELRFVRSESTFDYFAATDSYLRRHGKPVAFYNDKASSIAVRSSRPERSPRMLASPRQQWSNTRHISMRT
jgi:hypothetical protein